MLKGVDIIVPALRVSSWITRILYVRYSDDIPANQEV